MRRIGTSSWTYEPNAFTLDMPAVNWLAHFVLVGVPCVALLERSSLITYISFLQVKPMEA